MDFRIKSRLYSPSFPTGQFALGKHTGTLYFVPPEKRGFSIRGIALVGKSGVVAGEKHDLSPDEFLPPGTVIEITT